MGEPLVGDGVWYDTIFLKMKETKMFDITS